MVRLLNRTPVDWLFVLFGALIDLFQFFLEIALVAFGSTLGGAVGGAALGAKLCGTTCAYIGAGLGGLIGSFAQTTGVGEAIGGALGYLLDICITFSFGVFLVAILVFSGRLKGWSAWMITMGIFVLKLFPLLGLAPGWTVYAWKVTGKKQPIYISSSNSAATNTPANDNFYSPRAANDNLPQIQHAKAA